MARFCHRSPEWGRRVQEVLRLVVGQVEPDFIGTGYEAMHSIPLAFLLTAISDRNQNGIPIAALASFWIFDV